MHFLSTLPRAAPNPANCGTVVVSSFTRLFKHLLLTLLPTLLPLARKLCSSQRGRSRSDVQISFGHVRQQMPLGN